MLPDFGPSDRAVDWVAPLGASVLDMVLGTLPGLPPAMYDRLRVTIGEHVIPVERWGRVRPRPGVVVLIRAMPGATDYFRSALFLAVAVASIATGQFYGVAAANAALGAAGLTGFTATAATVNLATSLISATALFGGTLLVNALVPVRGADQSKDDRAVYSINGFQNRPNANGPVPQLWGRVRVAPPYAMLPYGEVVGRQRWIRAAFLLGQGRMDLSAAAPAIGTTALSKIDSGDYQITLREGTTGDDQLVYCTSQVIEENLNIQVRYDEGAQIRTTATEVTAVEVEIFFPGGLFHVKNDGSYIAWTATAVVETREVGATEWNTLGTVSATAMERRPFWAAQYFALPSRGTYEIKVTRYAVDDGSSSQQTAWSWSALRSFRPEYPLAFDAPMAVAELRMRASGRLNGTLDNFNLLATRIVPDWTGSAWVTQATRNPASIARAALQGPQNVWPEPDEALDLDAFQDWAEFCDSEGLEFNAYQVDEITRDDFLTDVASAGRAIVIRRGSVWTVSIDRERTTFYDLISPRNSWDLTETDTPPNFPDAFAIDFLDETNNYAPSRRVVRWPGFVGDPVVIEELRLPGKTHPDEIWIEARRRQYEAIYRRRSWTVSQDAEHLILTRGDAAILVHPVIDRRQTGGRVIGVDSGVVYVDEVVSVEAGLVYRVAFRAANGTITDRLLSTPDTGETRRLVLADAGTDPAVGDLATVYTTASPAIEVIVQKIERGDNHTAVLTLVPHAPEIFTSTAAEVPPAWDPAIGDTIGDSLIPAPATPVITSMVSTVDEISWFFSAGDATPVLQYQLRHREQGTSTWTTATALGGSDSITLDSSPYGSADVVEFAIRAVGVNSLTSSWSATYEHTVPGTTFAEA
ncbi:host specificity factor TipJ family phage tail protein [Rhodoplanes elegans]|uniref:host specificity factor TipJ family phage tail protein n=1 Tax=Rhodoplanes elegans TaxID=29408 RepID=UPI0019112D6B